MRKISFSNKVENQGATYTGKAWAADFNEIKEIVNENADITTITMAVSADLVGNTLYFKNYLDQIIYQVDISTISTSLGLVDLNDVEITMPLEEDHVLVFSQLVNKFVNKKVSHDYVQDWFEWDEVNQAIRVNHTLYSTGGLSAFGLGDVGSGGGGGGGYVQDWFEFDTVNNAIKAKYDFYSTGGLSAFGLGDVGSGGGGGGGYVHPDYGVDPYTDGTLGHITTATLNSLKSLLNWFEWDAENEAIKVKHTFYSTGGLSAFGLGVVGGGSGGGYERLDDWLSYDVSKEGWVLSAGLGYGLKGLLDGKSPIGHKHTISDISNFTPYSHPDYSQENEIGGTLGHIKASKMAQIDILLSLFERKGAGTELNPYVIEAKYDFYSIGGSSAYGLGVLGGGSGGYERLDDWLSYDTSKAGWVLSAGLGYGLKQSIDTINSSGLATQTWVTNQINALISDAPGTLDTLKEIAEALGNDPNFATTITNLIAEKEAKLGNPTQDGYLLSSLANGTRSWVAPYSHPDYSVEAGIGGTLGHVKASEKTAWNNHINSADKHFSTEERAYFNKLKNFLKVAADDTALYSTINFYSDDGVSAYGIGPSGGGGGGADLYDGLDKQEKGWALDASQGYVLNNLIGLKQPLNSQLTALSGLTGNGLIRKTGVNSYVVDSTSYEPKFTKNEAFNKNFGTSEGTVAEGNHTHDDRYYTETESDIRYAYKAGSSSQPFNTSSLTLNGTISGATTITANALILQNGNNVSWGGVYGANIPTIAGLSGVLYFYPSGSTNGQALVLYGNNSAVFSSTISALGGNSTQWNTAYGWGNHANYGYALAVNLSNHINDTSPHLSSEERAYFNKLKTYLKIAADNASMYSTINFYSESGVAAYGIGTGGGGGAGVDIIDDLISNRTDAALSANQGRILKGYIDLKQPQLNGTGLVRMSGTTVSYDNNSYALVSSLSNYSLTSHTHSGVYHPLMSTMFYLQSYYVGVRTANRTASQYYEFWDSGVGWAKIHSGGFVNANSSDSYILLGGGGTKAISDFSLNGHTHDDRYYTETEIGNFFSGSVGISGYNKSNWDTAYGWGNHASAGYALASSLSSHTGNTSNPHSVTAAQVGAIALSGTALTNGQDLNNLITLGTWFTLQTSIDYSLVNRPASITGECYIVNKGGNDYFEQEFVEINGNTKWFREYRGGIWGTWKINYNSGNSNRTTIDWAAKNLTLAGSITGATTITASSTIQATTAKLTNLTDGYIPYHISDGSGLGNSSLYYDGTNYGIGKTTSLTRNLSIVDTLGVYAGGGSQNHIMLYHNGVLGSIRTTYDSTGTFTPLEFITSNTSRLHIAANGNIGIGYTNRTEKLAVNGSGYFNDTLQALNFRVGGNYIKTTGVGCLELQSSSNELNIGGYTNMYVNYRAASGGTPTTWYWYKTVEAGYADFYLGALNTSGRIYSSSYIESASYLKGTSVKIGTNWEAIPSGTSDAYLDLKYNGVLKARLDSSGNITATGGVTAFAV